MRGDRQEALIRHLAKFATPERLAKMDRVLARRTRFLTVVLEDIFQPHNASAVLRSCECFGVQDAHIIESRHTCRVSAGVVMGADKWLTLRRYREPGADNTAACLENLKSRGYRIAATALRGDCAGIEEAPLDRPLALCFGTEESGLSGNALAGADLRVRLPMHGFTQSYNVSVCAALCLYELCGRLRREREDWKLPRGEALEVKLEWLRKCVKNSGVLEREFLAGDYSGG